MQAMHVTFDIATSVEQKRLVRRKGERLLQHYPDVTLFMHVLHDGPQYGCSAHLLQRGKSFHAYAMSWDMKNATTDALDKLDFQVQKRIMQL